MAPRKTRIVFPNGAKYDLEGFVPVKIGDILNLEKHGLRGWKVTRAESIGNTLYVIVEKENHETK